MFVVLTNASTVFKGQKLAISKNVIISVFENPVVDDEGNIIRVVTNIFAESGNTWEVEETFDDVIQRISN